MRVYLAGPMTGIKDYNFPAFEWGAAYLRARAHDVWSPHEEDLRRWGTLEGIKKNATYRECLRVDLLRILDWAEAIALLPGWDKSGGATLEYDLADLLELEKIYLCGPDSTQSATTGMAGGSSLFSIKRGMPSLSRWILT